MHRLHSAGSTGPPSSCGVLTVPSIVTMASVTLGASYWSLQGLVHAYQTLLRTNPILTKSVTSGIIACLGSSLSQVNNEQG